MTDCDTIRFLWGYMVHADARVLAAADSLPDEAYHREQGISFGSVHKQLVHCASAHHTWLQRLNGIDKPPSIPPESVPRSAVMGRWAAIHQELLAFADAQSPESLRSIVRGTLRNGTRFEQSVGICMLHVSDHATYHRGQISSMIKLAGGTPSPVMLFTFGLEHPSPWRG